MRLTSVGPDRARVRLVVDLGLITRQTFGTMLRPVRAAGDLLLNSPDGWVSNQPGPLPWDTQGSGTTPWWWVGNAVEDGKSPIGPHGPWTVGGRMPASVERATGLVIGPLTTLPWRVYRGRAPLRGSWRQSADAEDLGPALWMVDPQLVGNVPGIGRSTAPIWRRRPATSVWGQWLRDALWFGKGFITFAEAGNPQAGDPYEEPVAGTIANVSPTKVTEVLDDRGMVAGWRIGDDVTWVDVDTDGRYQLDGQTYRLLALWEPLGDGTGVFGRHAADLGLAISVRGYTSGTFRSGIPAGYLKVSQNPFTKPEADALKERWLQSHGGDQRSIAVLSAAVDFNPISVNPVDAQLVEVDHMVLRMVAHAFNLSARALDSGASSGNTYANIQDERHDRVDDSVMPWLSVLEDTLAGLLPYGTWPEVDVRGYLQSDPAARTAYYSAGIRDGWMFPGEARKLERLPAREDPEPGPAPPAVQPQLEEVPQ